MEEEIIVLLRDFGFPIFVCLWFMFRTEKIIGRNTDALNKLGEIVAQLCKQNGRRKN